MKRIISLLCLLILLTACEPEKIIDELITTPADSPTEPVDVSSDLEKRLQSELRAKGLAYGNPVFIRIFKQSSELEVWVKKQSKFHLFKTYKICNFSGRLGPKMKEGDMQAPEGFYYVSKRALNPHSSYHLSFNLGYPNSYDRGKGYTGSALMVHGNCVSAGCYAMTDAYIDEIYTLVEASLDNGQKFFRVHAFPFRLDAVKLEKHKKNRWYGFWKNLHVGYQYFETHKVPPNVTVKGGLYHFESDT